MKCVRLCVSNFKTCVFQIHLNLADLLQNLRFTIALNISVSPLDTAGSCFTRYFIFVAHSLTV